ncbi:NACHT domain-containing protein [Streptomyces sp. enrichment culture]|uniref:NACHT domain-containing protein n=1 Tax=Streptomyces sp. enrichment culture TaxID=1795815 RepID=UPI003F570ADE
MGKNKAGASPYATGGGGTVLEHRYGAVLLAHLLTETPLPALGADVGLVDVSFQASLESPVDDFLVHGTTPSGGARLVAIAVRRRPRLIPSDKKSVALIRDFLQALEDHREDITTGHLQLALAVAGPFGPALQLGELTRFARRNPDDQTFRSKVAAKCKASVRDRLKQLDRVVALAARTTEAGELTWRLLSALRVVNLRLEGDDLGDLTDAVQRLRQVVPNRDRSRAEALFDKLGRLVGDYAPTGARITLEMLHRDLDFLPQTPSVKDIEDCLRLMTEHLGRNLPEMVPLTLSMGTDSFESDGLVDQLHTGRHVHLAGPSGTGKSHLLRHAALHLAQRSWFPMYVRAGLYGEDGLQALLDDSLGPYSTAPALQLIRAARTLGRNTVLLVDGLNECPSSLRERLDKDLNALSLREGLTAVTTGQQSTPALLGSDVLTVEMPSAQQREKILHAYGADPDDERYGPFTTPMELSVAASLAGDLPHGAGRALLLDAYVRERLSTSENRIEVRRLLARWALTMDRQLTGALTMGEAERIALAGASSAVLAEALSCPLIVVARQRVVFTHELYQRLLAAHALAEKHTDNGKRFVRKLSEPRHQDLTEYALALAVDEDTVRRIMTKLPDERLIAQAVQGRFGQVAEGVASAQVRALLADTRRAMARAKIHFGKERQVTIGPAVSWDRRSSAILTAIGTALASGHLLEESIPLLAATDTALHRATCDQPRPSYETLPYLAGCAVAGGWGSLPAATILNACRLGLNWDDRPSPDRVIRLATSVDSRSYCMAYLACLLASRAQNREVAATAPRLARMCWDSNAYHLQLAALDMLLFVRRWADEETHQQLTDLIGDLDPTHPALVGQLVELKEMYGLSRPTETVETTESVTQQIHAVLAVADDPTPEINRLLPDFAAGTAYSIFTNQFEPVDGTLHYEAVAALDAPTRYRLLALAGTQTFLTSSMPVILDELQPAPADIALPAFETWAARLDPYDQESVAAHILGIVGCALHGHVLPPLAGPNGPTGDAWHCYGQILWSLHHPKLTEAQVEQHCAPLWQRLILDLPNVAADPLHWMSTTYHDPAMAALQRMLDGFPDRIRTILEYAIAHPVSHLDCDPFRDRSQRLMRMLVAVGDSGTVHLLSTLADDPTLGPDAVSAVRKLKQRATQQN